MENNTKQKIILITTGGTIEKTYDESNGSLTNRESIIQKHILSKLRLPYTEVHLFNIINKDSLNFTDYDRTLLAKTISLQMEKGCPIVILHGTDTMARSAEFCLKNIANISVPVVFTGAMKPMEITDSDAAQNVTEALVASKVLESGIYISFHGKVFNVPGVRKNPIARTFEEC